jgi:hypothetical protein
VLPLFHHPHQLELWLQPLAPVLQVLLLVQALLLLELELEPVSQQALVLVLPLQLASLVRQAQLVLLVLPVLLTRHLQALCLYHVIRLTAIQTHHRKYHQTMTTMQPELLVH